MPLFREGGLGVVLLCKDTNTFLLLCNHEIELVDKIGRHLLQSDALGFCTDFLLLWVVRLGIHWVRQGRVVG